MIISFLGCLIKKFKGKWFLIITLTIIPSIGYASYNFLADYNKPVMTMSLNYPEAEKGLNPDGTRFNIFEIKSEKVLDKALSKFSDSGLTVDQLRNRIDVYEKALNTTAEKVKIAKMSGDTFKYIPNEYTISYSQKNKFIKNHTIEMLTAIAEAYEEIFESGHGYNNSILQFDENEIAEYDRYEYAEIADLMLSKAKIIEIYISKRSGESGSYLSTETEETFINILEMINNFKNIEVEKFKAFIISSAITKDKVAYINKLKYTVDTLNFKKRKAVNESEFVKDTMEKYDPNITGVAFIPTLDKNDEFYMNRTKIGIDYLAESAYNAGITAESISNTIAETEYLIERFSTTDLNEEETTQLRETADHMFEILAKRLSEIQATALIADNEYISYRTRDYLKFNIPKGSIYSNLRLLPTALFGFWIFGGLLLFLILKEHLVRRIES